MIIKFIRAFKIDHRRDDEDDHKVVFVRTFMMDLMQRDAEYDDDGHGGGSMDDEEQDDDNAWTIRFSTISSTSHNIASAFVLPIWQNIILILGCHYHYKRTSVAGTKASLTMSIRLNTN